MRFSSWWVALLLVTPLPISAGQKIRRTPWVTYTLIALNVLVYLVTAPDRSPDLGNHLFRLWGLLPLAPRPVTLVTSLFFHVSLVHLFWNMAFLWLFGPHVEDAVGPWTFLILFLGGGITAGLLHMAVVLLFASHLPANPEPLVGASGAVSAILAPFAIRYHRAHLRLIWPVGFLLGNKWGDLEAPALAALGVWLAQNLAGAARGILDPASWGIAYWAHLGGFVFGLLTAELTGLFRDGRQEYTLEDARAAAALGRARHAVAVEKFRSFLELDPDNPSVRVELAAAEAKYGSSEERREAAREMAGAVRLFQRQGHHVGAIRACAQAVEMGLPLAFTSRERLRLSGAAQDQGDRATAIALLQDLIAETPDASESEIAHLRLGQLLLGMDPQAAYIMLSTFLENYPDSEWARRARDLRAEAALLADAE
jgi:membrane associated rhomboid family serine protease